MASMQDAAGQREPGMYKRAYKACEACRRSKSKCELRSTASEAPCVRCCRERRQCVFPLQRSNKRAKLAQSAGPSGHTGSTHRNGSTASDATSVPGRQRSRRGDAGAADVFDKDGTSPATPSREQTFPLPQQASESSLNGNLAKTMVTSSKDAMGLLFQAAEQNDTDSDSDDAGTIANGTVDPASPLIFSEMQLPPQLSKDTLTVWNKHRFVVQGWFSAFEAISYVEFFLHHFAPLSPVADFIHADHDTHRRLVVDEPLLCCTILMISSRHLPAHGPAGKTRSSFIHARLWRHIEHLVQRITFGAEKYSSAKSRTLGSIHALLLITEWHPRLLHFPPENDGWDAGLTPAIDDSFQPQDRTSETARRWREDVFEPAKRSDRLSWSLAGLAITLAHELGVFDARDHDGEPSEAEMSTQSTKSRIRKLLYLYSHQLSLRLGCPNMLPHGDHSVLQASMPKTPSYIDQATADREVFLTKWIEITKLLATATHMFFSSSKAIKNILRSYQYVGLLEHFQPLLNRWHEEFSRISLPTISAAARQALLVEYYYTRMYINSIALQALVERASQASSGDTWLEQDFLRKESTRDLAFIKDVRESSGQILVITKQLSEDGLLVYLPVRFFLRIVAASIFLLKTLSLGLKSNDAKVALDRLDDATQALMARDSDDIHLSSRYAELIARHVRRLKRKLHSQRSTRTFVAGKGTSDTTSLPSQVAPSQDHQRNWTGTRAQSSSSLAQDILPDSGDSGIDGAINGAESWSDALWDDILAVPLDPAVAPFGLEPTQSTAGLASDSLDFLWTTHI